MTGDSTVLSPNLESDIINVFNIRTSRHQIPERTPQGFKHERLALMMMMTMTGTLRTVMLKDLNCSYMVRQVQRDMRETWARKCRERRNMIQMMKKEVRGTQTGRQLRILERH